MASSPEELADGLSALSLVPRGAETYGIVLDLHYLQIAAASYSLQTAWSVASLEAALMDACGGSTSDIAARYACDSAVAESPAPGDVRGYGKAALHRQLVSAGYDLVLSPSKAMSGAQGATDVDVACSIYAVAGAFAPAPRATTLVLFAADADFRPALSQVIKSRGPDGFRALVVADASAMARPYREWISQSEISHLDLGGILGAIAPHVLDLRGRRPTKVSEILDACAAMAERLAAEKDVDDCRGGAVRRLTLNLSGGGELPWGDAQMRELIRGLIARRLSPSLGELWVHHTEISDGCCTALGELIGAAESLDQLHVSDSRITHAGLEALVNAARAAGCGVKHGRKKLYINVRHLGDSDPDASRVRAEGSDCASIRLGRPIGGPAGGRGKGKGSGKGKGRGGKGRGVGRGGVQHGAGDELQQGRGRGRGRGAGKGGRGRGRSAPNGFEPVNAVASGDCAK